MTGDAPFAAGDTVRIAHASSGGAGDAAVTAWTPARRILGIKCPPPLVLSGHAASLTPY